MGRMSRRYRQHKMTLPEITLTPLIDTALTLLVIFMVTSPLIQNAIKVQLPHGNAKEIKDATEELVVYIDKDGVIYFNGKPMKFDQLIAVLKQKVGRAVQKIVFVKADERVSYGTVIETVDQIKVVGGIDYVALATQRKT